MPSSIAMVDNLSRKSRSELMSRIGPKDSKPEMVVRKMAHALGYRFRLHRKDLPGSPDLVFPSRRKVIFVHGCFWHRHQCKLATTPKSNVKFWSDKFKANVERDRKNTADLSARGWESMVIWQCQTRDTTELRDRLVSFLETKS